MVLNLTLYEIAYRALRRSTAVASAAWSRMDCRIQRTNLTLRWVARRACRTRVDRSWPAAAHFSTAVYTTTEPPQSHLKATPRPPQGRGIDGLKFNEP